MRQLSLLMLSVTALAFTWYAPVKNGSLQGWITAQTTNVPLADVTITAFLDGKDVASATTDQQGHYQLDIAPATYSFEISKPDYESLRLLNVPISEGPYNQISTYLTKASSHRQQITKNWDASGFRRVEPVVVTPPKETYLAEKSMVIDSVPATATLPSEDGKTYLIGKITDAKTGENLPGVTIKMLHGTSFIKGAITDIEGNYKVIVSPLIDNLEVSYTGYQTVKVNNMPIREKYLNLKNVAFENTIHLSEVVITQVAPAEYSPAALTSDEIKKGPAKVASAPAAAPIDGGEVVIKGSRAEKVEYYIDGIRTPGAVPPPSSTTARKAEPAKKKMKSERPASDVVLLKEASRSAKSEAEKDKKDLRFDDSEVLVTKREETIRPITQPVPSAGVLTAGEWNDLDNWNKHWADLLSDGETNDYQKIYGFYPKYRYSVLLHNTDGFPIIDAAITLSNAQGQTLWEARTDNTGKAELWYAMNELTEKNAVQTCQLSAVIDGKKQVLGTAKPFTDGINTFRIQRDCKAPQLLDIVWAVDATGSMSDEIEFLKTELLDVINRVKNNNRNLTVRMGSVFYRDDSDAYLVKSNGLSPDIASTINYISEQYADGGGDTPEAVHSALEEVVYRQKWSDEAVARICFLVLDASPHQTPTVVKSLQRTIREAARKGIRIVPVSASGIEKDTEFLMKFFGLATNGSYVFLTDDSGVGGKHLAPTTDEYKVEPFNNLLVRLITQYASVATCDGKSIIAFERTETPKGDSTAPLAATFYPNPATTVLHLELPVDAQKVTVYNAEGVSVYQLTTLQKGAHHIPVQQLPAGYYSIRIWAEQQVQSGKVMVVGM